MTNLIDLIKNKDLVAAKKALREKLESIKATKLVEMKKMVSAKMFSEADYRINEEIEDYDAPYKRIKGDTAMAKWMKNNVTDEIAGEHQKYGTMFKGNENNKGFAFNWKRTHQNNKPVYVVRMAHHKALTTGESN